MEISDIKVEPVNRKVIYVFPSQNALLSDLTIEFGIISDVDKPYTISFALSINDILLSDFPEEILIQKGDYKYYISAHINEMYGDGLVLDVEMIKYPLTVTINLPDGATGVIIHAKKHTNVVFIDNIRKKAANQFTEFTKEFMDKSDE